MAIAQALRAGVATAALAFLAACAGGAPTPDAAPQDPAGSRMVVNDASEPVQAEIPALAGDADAAIDARPAAFSDLPGWDEADHDAVLRAFLLTCPRFDARNASDPAGPAFHGQVADWRRVCTAAKSARAGTFTAKGFFEAAFTPLSVTRRDGRLGKTTAYYEPVIEARREAYGPFGEPMLAKPDDLVVRQVPGDRYSQTMRQEVFQRWDDGTLALYQDRGVIRQRVDIPVLAWGRLEDVIFLQIQGSGRLRFADGTQMRAAFAAHNGLPYKSISRVLMDRGLLPEGGASNDAVKRWLAAARGGAAESVVNANPRYAFFSLKPIGDPSLGPVGAANVPLTADVTHAIDPDYHLIGGLYYIAPEGAGAPAPRLSVAQDTGGAILGPLRSDLFFGTGPQAGEAAARINHATRWWMLAPRPAG